MSCVTKRTLLAFTVGALLCIPGGMIAKHFGLEGWAQTLLIVLPILVLTSLVDRDYFYGRPPGAPRR